MYIDKQHIILEYFNENKDRIELLKNNLFEKDTFSLELTYQGIEAKYYTDDQLYFIYPNGLPDNIDGNTVLFFNTDDTVTFLDV